MISPKLPHGDVLETLKMSGGAGTPAWTCIVCM